MNKMIISANGHVALKINRTFMEPKHSVGITTRSNMAKLKNCRNWNHEANHLCNFTPYTGSINIAKTIMIIPV